MVLELYFFLSWPAGPSQPSFDEGVYPKSNTTSMNVNTNSVFCRHRPVQAALAFVCVNSIKKAASRRRKKNLRTLACFPSSWIFCQGRETLRLHISCWPRLRLMRMMRVMRVMWRFPLAFPPLLGIDEAACVTQDLAVRPLAPLRGVGSPALPAGRGSLRLAVAAGDPERVRAVMVVVVP